MNTHSIHIRPDLQKAFYGFVSLLGSSVISAIGFIIIASNRWVHFDAASGVFIILFVQWQTLGLTMAKTGIEQVVFALVSDNDRVYLEPSKYIFRKALPLAGLFSVAVIFVFSPLAAIVAFSTILLDTWSLLVMADLNARKQFTATALANLVNYPVFFIAVFTLNHFNRLDIPLTLAMFFLSSALRCLWLKYNQFTHTGMKEVVCKVNLEMGIQQTLNYILFRADQIILAVMSLRVQAQEGVSMYVFLAKFPELVSGVAVIAGTVMFPRYFIRYPFDLHQLAGFVRKYAACLTGYIAALTLAIWAYVSLWSGLTISLHLAIPFLLQTLCILLVNNLTYSAIRQGYLRRLLINLSLSVAAGLSIAAFFQFKFDAIALAWLVPAQLLTLIILSLGLKWGKPSEIYV